jgi:hypothetical protein
MQCDILDPRPTHSSRGPIDRWRISLALYCSRFVHESYSLFWFNYCIGLPMFLRASIFVVSHVTQPASDLTAIIPARLRALSWSDFPTCVCKCRRYANYGPRRTHSGSRPPAYLIDSLLESVLRCRISLSSWFNLFFNCSLFLSCYRDSDTEWDCPVALHT